MSGVGTQSNSTSALDNIQAVVLVTRDLGPMVAQ
jgi:hypothetical protein